MPKSKTVVPRDFPSSKEMRKIVQLGESANVRGIAMESIKANWRAICYDICSGLAAHDLAAKYGSFSERSFWNFLKKISLTYEDIKKACRAEEEFRRMTKLEKLQKKMERLKLVPTDIEQLATTLDWWDKVRARVKPETLMGYAKVWLELIEFTGKHPSDITLEDIENFIVAKKLEWQEQGLDLNKKHIASNFSGQIITPLRVFAQYQGIPMSPELKTKEYESPYRAVKITVEERFKILEYIEKHYPRDFEWVKAALFALYYNGHRANELTTIRFEPRNHIVLVFTSGKKGLEYTKILRRDVYEMIKEQLPLSSKQVEKLRKVLKNAYEAVLKPGSVTRYYALELKDRHGRPTAHPIHTWRHTACNELIDYSDYNLSLIMQMLGWKNPSMITKVYGEATPEMVARAMGWLASLKHPFDFFYNEYEVTRENGKTIIRLKNAWLDEAYRRGWVSKEYYETVKEQQRRLIDEFIRKTDGNIEVVEQT